MDENNFHIDNENADSVIVDLLMTIVARQKVMHELLLKETAVKTGENIDDLMSLYDTMLSFQKNKLSEELYLKFASLKDLLPPQIDESND